MVATRQRRSAPSPGPCCLDAMRLGLRLDTALEQKLLHPGLALLWCDRALPGVIRRQKDIFGCNLGCCAKLGTIWPVEADEMLLSFRLAGNAVSTFRHPAMIDEAFLALSPEQQLYDGSTGAHLQYVLSRTRSATY